MTSDSHYADRELYIKQLQTEHDSMEALYRIVQLLLMPVTLTEKLDRALEILFTVPWLEVEHKGSIFLANTQQRTLHIVSKRHLSPQLHECCATIPFGYCLCGRAAEQQQLVYCNHLTEQHDQRFVGISDHGHYCQPIMAEGQLLGLINLYVAPHHIDTPAERDFLQAVSDTLASMITHEQMKESNQRLAAIIEETPDCVAITDKEGVLSYANAAARQLMGIAHEITPNDSYASHLTEQGQACFRQEAMSSAQEHGVWQGECTLIDQQGTQIPVNQTLISHRDAEHQISHYSVIAHDVTINKQAESAALAAAVREQYFANVLINGLPGIFYLLNHDKRIIRWNNNLEQVTGYSQQELLLMRQERLVSPSELTELNRATLEAVTHGASAFEMGIRTKFGARIPYFINSIKIASIDGAELSVAGIGVDISYRHELELELKRRATTDSLTGINNRSRMEEMINHHLIQHQRYGNPFAIIMFDIDHFKQVNDTYGHDVGDQVLRTLVLCAGGVLRESDLLARWGGEEFMVLVPAAQLQDGCRVAEKLRLAISNSPFPKGLPITASFGVTEAFKDATIRSLVIQADSALYRAKNHGRNRVCHWDAAYHKKME